MNLLGIGTLFDSFVKIAGYIITTDKERLEVELRHRELDQAPMMGQIAINRAEDRTMPRPGAARKVLNGIRAATTDV